MKESELKALNDKELKERLKEERALSTKLKIQHAISSIENPARITVQRKMIARILTETKERSMSKSIPSGKASSK
jgi:large subunit ribosomal protein L29